MKISADSIANMAAPILLTAAVVWVCATNFQTDLRDLKTWQSVLADPWHLREAYAHVDNLFGRQTPSGNIWVKFDGFRQENPADEAIMTLVYYRGNYAIYPRRIYVSLPSTVVKNGKAMVPGDDLLNPELAKKLGIRWTVIFSRDPRGQLNGKIERLP